MSDINLILCLVVIITLNIIGLYIVKLIVDIQPIRFLAVGSLNTWTYMLVFTILNIKLEYLIAHLIAFLTSACISYVLTTVYTFNNKITLSTALRFPLTFLPNLIFSTVGTAIVVNLHLISEKYASFTMMLLAIPVTFIVSKLLLEKK